MTNSIIKAEKHFRFSKAFFALFAIIIFFQTNASCQFTAVSGLSNYPIMNIDILSPTQVWMVSYDKAFKSTNGAASFSTVLLTDTTNTASPQSIEMIYPGIHGLNMNKAFLFNNFDIPGDGIMKTNLGNGNWGSVYSSSSNPEYNNRIVDLDIASDGVGIAAGGNGIILRTTDFGNNWNVVSTGPTAQPNNYVHYFGNETWIITSIHHVLKSYDHGLTWTTIELEYINDNLWSILDFSAVGDVCYITTNQLSFGKSLNQGETWEFIEVPFFTASISAGSADVVYCSDYVFEKLYKSIDGGNTWEYVPITGSSSINDIEFYNESFGGLGVTGVGAMFTTNGGGPTLPYCSFTLDPYSCSGENLPIVNQCFNVPGNTYEWYINGTLVSTEFDLEYQVANPSYIDIELVVTNSNGSNSFSKETNVVAPPTIPIVNVTFPQDTICANSSLVFTVQSSQSGTNYRFFKDGIFISGQNGTGSNMTFNTGALTQDTFVEIKGIRSTTCRTDTTVFSQQITVVSMDPTIEVFLPADSICRNITPLFIGITNTNPLWSYRYNSTGSTFYPGNGDTLLIPFTTSNTSPFIPAIVAKFNQTGCTINKNATTQLVPILASSALTVSPNIVETDEIVNLNLSSNYLQHFWEFAPYASVNEYYGLINEITYSTTGRDTIVLNEIFADSSCFTTHKKQVNIVENIVPEEPTFCSSNSNVITKQTLRAIVDEYGNHIICGFYLSSGNSPSLFVRKENVFGELVFEKTATVNNASTYGISVATDEEQNIYLIGQSVAGNTIWNNYLTNSTFFAKLNQQGDVEWFLSSPEYNYLDLGITNNQIYILCKSSSSTSDISIDQSNGETFELPIPFGLTSNIDFFVEMSLDGIINNVTTTGIGSGIQNPNSHNTIGFLRSSPIAYPKMKIKDNKLFILAEMSTYNESFTYAIGNSIIENTIVGIEGQNSNGNLAYFKWDLGTNDMSCKLIMNASLIVPHDFEILDNSVLAISDFNYTGFYDAEGPHFEFMELMNTKRSCILNLDFEGNVNWKRIEFFSNYYHLERASATSAYAIISADAEASILSNNTNFGYTPNGLSGCILATLHEDGSVTDFINLDEPERDAVQSMQLDACGNLLITKGNNLYSYLYPINNYSATSTWTVSKIGFGPCNENCSANALNQVFDLAVVDIELVQSVETPSQADVYLDIQNTGGTTVTSTTINFVVNNIQYSFDVNTTLLPSESLDDILIGTIDLEGFSLQHMSAELALINGLSADDIISNNSIERSQWICISPISGDHYVGQTNQEFSTFQQTATALQTCGIDGPVNFIISPGDYYGQLIVPVFAGNTIENPVTWTSTTGNNEDVRFYYANDNIQNSNHIVISSDVSFLSFESITVIDSLILGQQNAFVLSNNANNINIENCAFFGLNNDTQKIIYSAPNSLNTNTSIVGNVFYEGGSSISMEGSSTNKDTNTIISENFFSTPNKYSVNFTYGLNTYFESNLVIDSTYNASYTLFFQNCFGDLQIQNNEILSNQDGVLKIQTYTGNVNDLSKSIIANNFITNWGNDYSNEAIALIGVSNMGIWHNTLQKSILINNSTAINIQNNIIGDYATLVILSGTTSGLTMDYNQYYPDNNGYAYFSTTSQNGLSFETWKANTGYDLHSIMQEPLFASDYDSHILSLFNTGTPISFVQTDIDGEPRSLSLPVIGADEPLDIPFQIYVVEASSPSCFGFTDGTIEVSSLMGEGLVQYIWSDGYIGSLRENIAAGSYTVTATDEANNTATATYDIEDPGYFDIEINLTTDCFVGYNAFAGLEIQNQVNPLTYLWSTGSTQGGLNSLGAGEYWVTVTNGNGCIAQDTASFDLTPYLVSQNQIIQTSCPQPNGGLIDINVQGGDGNYSYSWSNGQTSQDISGLEPGTYSVTVTDGDGCQLNFSRTLYQPLEIVASADSECVIGSTGSASYARTGGGLGFDYQWSNGATTNEISNLSQGWYIIQVTDGTGCVASDSVYISEMTWELSLDSTNQVCQTNEIASIYTSVDDTDIVSSILWSNGATDFNLESILPGTYELNVTDSLGCSQQVSATIYEVPVAEITHPLNCFDGNNAQLELNTSGLSPESILWNNGNTSSSISNLPNGEYSVDLSYSNGCALTLTYFIDETIFNIQIDTIIHPVCWYSSGEVELTIEGGLSPFEYNWSNGLETLNLFDAIQGSYSFSISDAMGCQQSLEVELVAQSQPFSFDLIGSDAAYLDSTGIFTAEIPDGSSISWLVTDALILDSNEDSLWVEFNELGFAEIFATMTNEYGCISNYQIDVFVEEYIGVIENNTFQISAYPNPASDLLSIISNHGKPIEVRMLDSNGRLVQIKTFVANTSLDVNHLASGNYTLVFSENGKVIDQKQVIIGN